MRARVNFAGIALLTGLALSAGAPQTWKRAVPAVDKTEIERGRYLVEEVAKCSECHTPRKPDGQLDSAVWLRGASIWIRPLQHVPNWADNAPALSGLPSFTEEQVERVLEKGTGPEGEALRPPMHIYHLEHADAKAIAAYLKSLPAPRH